MQRLMWRATMLVVAAGGCASPARRATQEAYVEPQVMLRHRGATTFAVTSDGRFGATGSSDRSVIVWDLRDGRRLQRIYARQSASVSAIALSDDGTRLAIATGEVVTLWDVAHATVVWSAKPDADRLAFTADGTRLVGSRIGVPRVWAATNGAVVWSGNEHEGAPPGYDTRRGVSPTGHESIEMTGFGWHEVDSGDVTEMVPRGFRATLYDLDGGRATPLADGIDRDAQAVGLAGDRAVIVDRDALVLLAVATGKLIARIPMRAAIVDAVAQAGDRVLAWGTKDTGSLVVWDVATRRELWRTEVTTDSRPVLAGGEIVVLRDRETCTARRIADGTVAWQRSGCAVVGTSATSPTMLVGDGREGADIIDAATGRPMTTR